MKRLTIFISCLFISSLSYAANKMSMVTYFPVPYVAYSQVSADQQLDVGLTTTCNMNLGCSQSNTNLKASTVNLKGGKLELNQGKGVAGTSITLGTGTGNGQISFKDVRIQGGNMQSLNADTMNVQTLNLFGKPFPPCNGKGGSDGQMQWRKLKLQGYSGTDPDGELYLTCGKAGTTGCQPTKGQSYQEQCPNSSQKITYTWDSVNCRYNADGVCPQNKKVCLVFASCTSWWVRTNPLSVNSGSCSSLDTKGGSFGHALESWFQPWLEQNGYAFASCGDNKPCEAPAGVQAGSNVLSARGGNYGMWEAPCENDSDLYYVQAQRLNTVEVSAGETCPSAGQAKECSNWPY